MTQPTQLLDFDIEEYLKDIVADVALAKATKFGVFMDGMITKMSNQKDR